MPGKMMDMMNMSPKDYRNILADEAEVRTRDAADHAEMVAQSLSETGNDPTKWKQFSEELQGILKRMKVAAR